MGLLFKILRKLILFAMMLAMMGYAAKYGWKFAMKVGGVPQVSSEESDLMSTVFDSAVKLVTGSAKKDQLASELSDKLYAGRASSAEMKELGIEIVKPGGGGSPAAAPGLENPPTAVADAGRKSATPSATQPDAAPSLGALKKRIPLTVLGKIFDKLKDDRVGMSLIPIAFVGMVASRRFRRKDSKMDDLLPSILAMQNSNDAELDTMQHAVQTLRSEDFELLIALIYQRQGYRVSMSAGQSGGRGGDFILARKAEKLLVQCKKLACEHRVAVERVREFHEAMVTAGFTKGMYVASCGYSWDARHFAKTKGITLINARTLDQLLIAAAESPDEDFLAVAKWAPKLMQKVTLTPALCPACDAAMDEIVANGQPVWLCSQRPDCRGRRLVRKRWKATPAAEPSAPAARVSTEPSPARGNVAAAATKPTPQSSAPAKPVASRRLNFTRLASRRIPAQATAREVAPLAQPAGLPAREIPPPAPASTDDVVCRPASLKSVVPRARPIQKSAPDRAVFDLLRNVEAQDCSTAPTDVQKRAEPVARREAKNSARPATRIESSASVYQVGKPKRR